jgi:hypothetical protein
MFVVNLPVGLATWLVGRWVLPRPPARRQEPVPDLVGSALLIIFVGVLTGALVQAPGWGWTSPRTAGLLVLAAMGAIAFGWRSRRHPFPMVEPALLKVPSFLTANLATFLLSASFAIMLLSNSLWCQDVWNYSALRTGLAMAPGPAVVPLVTFASSQLVRRAGPGRVAAAGCVLWRLCPQFTRWSCPPPGQKVPGPRTSRWDQAWTSAEPQDARVDALRVEAHHPWKNSIGAGEPSSSRSPSSR